MTPSSHDADELFVPIDAERTGSLADIGMSEPEFFPSPFESNADGLVCVGGQLSPPWLLDAYGHGIFPWPVWEDEPLAWWSPDPRAIIEFDAFHISRRLARTLRSSRFQVSCDRDFAGVIHGCATAGDRIDGTWLTSAMIDAYTKMHRLGHAHSVEVWEGSRLVGGTYGIAIGGLFAAESMFYQVRDASKVALAHLVAHLRARGYRLLDIQQWTPHTGRLGAVDVDRARYLRRLAEITGLDVSFGGHLEGDLLGRADS